MLEGEARHQRLVARQQVLQDDRSKVKQVKISLHFFFRLECMAHSKKHGLANRQVRALKVVNASEAISKLATSTLSKKSAKRGPSNTILCTDGTITFKAVWPRPDRLTFRGRRNAQGGSRQQARAGQHARALGDGLAAYAIAQDAAAVERGLWVIIPAPAGPVRR